MQRDNLWSAVWRCLCAQRTQPVSMTFQQAISLHFPTVTYGFGLVCLWSQQQSEANLLRVQYKERVFLQSPRPAGAELAPCRKGCSWTNTPWQEMSTEFNLHSPLCLISMRMSLSFIGCHEHDHRSLWGEFLSLSPVLLVCAENQQISSSCGRSETSIRTSRRACG